jgi:hypothetical protein
MARALGSGRPSHGPPTVGPLAALPQPRPLKCGVIGWQSVPCSGALIHWLPCFTTTPNNRQAMTREELRMSRPLDAMCLEKGRKGLLFPFGPAWYGRLASAKDASLASNQDTEPTRPELARKIRSYFIPAPGANMEALRSRRRLHILSFIYHIRKH